MRQRLERLGTCATFVLAALEEEVAVARALQHLLRGRPTSILIASTTAPAGPEDVIGRAMLRAGCHIERFLAPVEPGNLLMLGYKDEVPVVSAPGCFRSAKPNVVDLVLPPMLARYHVTGWEIACLGIGGLLPKHRPARPCGPRRGGSSVIRFIGYSVRKWTGRFGNERTN